MLVRKPPARRGAMPKQPPTKPPRASADTSNGPRRRTRQRVNEDEPKTRQIRDTVVDRQHNKGVNAVAEIVNGEVLVTGQVSETVPVAQYANVVLLSGLQWKLGGINMEDLIDVNWGGIDDDGESDTYGDSTFDYDAMTPRQKAAYDRIRGATRATMQVIEHGNAEDRETVERSVRLANEREAAEEAKEKAPEKAKRQRRRASST